MTQIKKTFALLLVWLLAFCPLICCSQKSNNKEVSDVAEQDSVIDERETHTIRTWEKLHPTLQIKVCPDIMAATLTPTTTPIPTPTVTPTKELEPTPHEHWQDGWTSGSVNVRQEPNTDCKILDKYQFNTYIYFTKENENWVKIQYGKGIAYIHKDYVSLEKCNYIEYAIPNHSGQKSWMSWKAITLKTSKQYKLQHEYAYTGEHGIRMVNGRYCIAVGSHFKTDIGQYLDVVLENGTVLQCIMGDQKADKDTDKSHIFTGGGCCSEFIIDRDTLNKDAKISGNMSSVCKEWDSPVKYIRVYETNVLK